jgi:hypothetical protein
MGTMCVASAHNPQHRIADRMFIQEDAEFCSEDEGAVYDAFNPEFPDEVLL